MKTDSQLRSDVIDELSFDPSIFDQDLVVVATDGVVTLAGSVPSYADKYAAERAAFRVAGVRAIADEITVKLPTACVRSDQDIAQAASDALTWHVQVPETIQISVEDGVVILRGEVDWQYQRDAATAAIRCMTGIKGLKNRLKIRKKVQVDDVKERIEQALVRTAEDDAHKIVVTTSKGKVTLKGKVRSHAEMEDAKWAAWAAPGVNSVDNQLTVG